MDLDITNHFSQVSRNTHYRPAGPDTGDKGIRLETYFLKLRTDLGTGSKVVRFGIGKIRKLVRKKHPPVFVSKGISHRDTAEKSTLVVTHQRDLCTVALDQRDAFTTHPVGHENMDRISERVSYRRKRNACITARRLGNDVTLADRIVAICSCKDVKGHPILDASREIQVLGLRKDSATFSVVMTVDREQWCVADQVFNVRRTRGHRRVVALVVAKAVDIHRLELWGPHSIYHILRRF